MSSNKVNSPFAIKNMESSNLFQRRMHHTEHNYDFVGGYEDTHESNTNTLKVATDKNDNLKVNYSREFSSLGGGGGLHSKMEKSTVKFEINRGSVTHLIKSLSES
jgi:hypothetical protein